MKTANELKEISNKQGINLIKKFLDNIEQHIEKKCEQESLKGNHSCTIHLDKITYELKNEMLEECIKIAKKIELDNYDVIIKSNDFNNDDEYNYNVNIQIGIYWDKRILNYNINRYKNNILYITNKKLNQKCSKCDEEKDIFPRCIHLDKDHNCNNINGCCFK